MQPEQFDNLNLPSSDFILEVKSHKPDSIHFIVNGLTDAGQPFFGIKPLTLEDIVEIEDAFAVPSSRSVIVLEALFLNSDSILDLIVDYCQNVEVKIIVVGRLDDSLADKAVEFLSHNTACKNVIVKNSIN